MVGSVECRRRLRLRHGIQHTEMFGGWIERDFSKMTGDQTGGPPK